MRRGSAIGLFVAVMVTALLCTPSSAMAAVDNSFVFLTVCLLGCPEIPDEVRTSLEKRFVQLVGSETYGFAKKAPRHCVPGSTKAPFLLSGR